MKKKKEDIPKSTKEAMNHARIAEILLMNLQDNLGIRFPEVAIIVHHIRMAMALAINGKKP